MSDDVDDRLMAALRYGGGARRNSPPAPQIQQPPVQIEPPQYYQPTPSVASPSLRASQVASPSSRSSIPFMPAASLPNSSRSSIPTNLPVFAPSQSGASFSASPSASLSPSFSGRLPDSSASSVSSFSLDPVEPARSRSQNDPRVSINAADSQRPTILRSSTVGYPMSNPASPSAGAGVGSSAAGLMSPNAILEAQQRAFNRARSSSSAVSPNAAASPLSAAVAGPPSVARQGSMVSSAASPRSGPVSGNFPQSPTDRSSISNSPQPMPQLTPEQIAIARARRKEAEEAALALALSLSMQSAAPEKDQHELELEAVLAASKAESDRAERKLRILKAKEEEALALATVLSHSEMEEKARVAERARNAGPSEEEIIQRSRESHEDDKQRKYERDAKLGRLHEGQIPAQAVHDEIMNRAKKRTEREAKEKMELEGKQ